MGLNFARYETTVVLGKISCFFVFVFVSEGIRGASDTDYTSQTRLQHSAGLNRLLDTSILSALRDRESAALTIAETNDGINLMAHFVYSIVRWDLQNQ